MSADPDSEVLGLLPAGAIITVCTGDTTKIRDSKHASRPYTPISLSLPLTSLQLIEEKATAGGNVHACIALDFITKDRNGKPKSERMQPNGLLSVRSPSKASMAASSSRTWASPPSSFVGYSQRSLLNTQRSTQLSSQRSTQLSSQRSTQLSSQRSTQRSSIGDNPSPVRGLVQPMKPVLERLVEEDVEEEEEEEAAGDVGADGQAKMTHLQMGSFDTVSKMIPSTKPTVVAMCGASSFASPAAAPPSSSRAPAASSRAPAAAAPATAAPAAAAPAPSATDGPPSGRKGAAHKRVQSKLGSTISLSTSIASGQQQQQQQRSAGLSSQRESAGQSSYRESGLSSRRGNSTSKGGSKASARRNAEKDKTGWATIVRAGERMVTTKVRLNVEARQQYQQQWARRIAIAKTAENMKKDGDEGDKPKLGGRDVQKTMMKSLSHELESAKAAENAAAFAYGGLYPGTLHAKGKLLDSHKVFYSIGIAGQYLLHVRLRSQGTALQGSPFYLSVLPGPPYALASTLPSQLSGEVGGRSSYCISTADQVGNPCHEGGGKVTCGCEDPGVEGTCTDNGDGSYTVAWDGKKTGSYRVSVKIDNTHVVGSPATLTLSSSLPDLSMCEASGQGLSRVVKGEASHFDISFRDGFGNATIQSPEFRASFRAGMMFTAPGLKVATKGTLDHDCTGKWVEGEVHGVIRGKYQISFVASTSGAFALHVWVENVHAGERVVIPGSPFDLGVHASATDNASQLSEVVDQSGIMPGDYKVSREVFEEAQKIWGECSIDAFASVATAMLPKFWTAKAKPGMDTLGVNAFKQEWPKGDRIWAHPPLELMDNLAAFLQSPGRLSEVIVCAPYRPSTDWFFQLSKVTDDKKKFMAGKLVRVADDAPGRIGEWPVMLFHVPPRKPPKANPKAEATAVPASGTTVPVPKLF